MATSNQVLKKMCGGNQAQTLLEKHHPLGNCFKRKETLFCAKKGKFWPHKGFCVFRLMPPADSSGVFSFFLSFGQNFPFLHRKAFLSFWNSFRELSAFPEVFVPDCRHTFFSKSDLKLPFVGYTLCGVLHMYALLQKARKGLNLWTFLLSDWNQSTGLEKRRNHQKGTSSWRACPAGLRVFIKKTFFLLSSSSSLFWVFYFCSVLVRTFPLLHRKVFLSF